MCVFGCVWLVVPGFRKPHSELAQPGIGLDVGAKLGSAWSENLIQNGLNRVSGAYLIAHGFRKPHSGLAQPGTGARKLPQIS